MHSRRFVVTVAAGLAVLAAFAGCELLTGGGGSQGEHAGPQGPQGPQGEPGEDGNANVDLYIFGSHNFNTSPTAVLHVDDVDETEMKESAWLVYLLVNNIFYQIPGPGLNGLSTYRSFVFWSNSMQRVVIEIRRTDGSGEGYDEIRVIRIGASNVTDNRATSAPEQSLIPAHLDTSDYHAVVEYFGLDG
jgi:hypothetical protein